MRAVVDTNVFVRAIIKPQGTVGPVLTRLHAREYTLLYSEPTVAALRDVLTRPRMILTYGISDATVEAVVAGNADVIVSGDEDLLVLSPFEGIPIVGPAAFLAMLEQGPPHC